MKIGPFEIRWAKDEEEEKQNPEEPAHEFMDKNKWCPTCNEWHLKPRKFETYEDWCIRVGHKPINPQGIYLKEYRINKQGYVVKRKKRNSK